MLVSVELNKAFFINYGGEKIHFQLSFSNRKLLEISVHPDKTVSVKAPLGTDLEIVEARLKTRVRWVRKQIRYFDQFHPKTPKRQYLGGESHFYLGKKYRLKIMGGEFNKVLLRNGFFEIFVVSNEAAKIEALLENWYRKKALVYFGEILNDCWKNIRGEKIRKPPLKIVKLTKRWGSLSKKGTLSLNLNLIKAPKECIEYVILHELCHLVHHNHSPEFFKLLDRSLPDWVKRKHKLEMALV